MASYEIEVTAKVNAGDIQSQLGGPYSVEVIPHVQSAVIQSQLQGSVQGASRAGQQIGEALTSSTVSSLSGFGNATTALLEKAYQQDLAAAKRSTTQKNQIAKASSAIMIEQARQTTKRIEAEEKIRTGKAIEQEKRKTLESKAEGNIRVAAEKENLKRQTAIEKENRKRQAAAEKETQRFQNKIGANIGTIRGDFSSTDNMKNHIKSYYGSERFGNGNVSVKAAGSTWFNGQEWQKFNTEVGQADGTVRKFTTHVNTATGEARSMGKGFSEASKRVKNELSVFEDIPNLSSIPDQIRQDSYESVYGNARKRAQELTLANGGSFSDADANSKMAVSAEKLQTTGKAITDLTNSAVKFVSVPIAAAAGASVKAFMDYETAFTGVRKTVDGTDEELQAVSDGLESMALRVPVASTQLANIAMMGGQLGVPTDKLLKFTEAYAGLEVATNLQGEEGAATLARFMNVMNESFDNVSNVGSAIVDLGNHTATTENEIAQMATRMGSAGSIIGMSTADVLGYSAALSSLGVRAEMGGSAMTRIWQDIATAVSTGGDSLDEYAKKSKVSAQEFSDAWKSDPTKAFNTFLKGLSESDNIIGDLQDLGIKNVRDVQSLEKLAQRYDLVTDCINRANQAYGEDIALQNEASRAYSTTASKLQMSKEAVVQASRDIGAALAPTIISVSNGFAKAAKGFASWDEGAQKSAVSGALLTAGAIAGVNAIGKMYTSIGLAKAAVTSLAGAFGTTTATLGIWGAGLAAAGVVAYAGYTAYTKYKSAQEEALRQQHEVGSEFTKSVSGFKEQNNELWESNKLLREYSETLDSLNSKESVSSPEALKGDNDYQAALQRESDLRKQLNDRYGIYLNTREKENRISSQSISLFQEMNALEEEKAKYKLEADTAQYQKSYKANQSEMSAIKQSVSNTEEEIPRLAKNIQRLDEYATKLKRLEDKYPTGGKSFNSEKKALFDEYSDVAQNYVSANGGSRMEDSAMALARLERTRRQLSNKQDWLVSEKQKLNQLKQSNLEAEQAALQLAQIYANEMPSAISKGDSAVESLYQRAAKLSGMGQDDAITKTLAAAREGFTDLQQLFDKDTPDQNGIKQDPEAMQKVIENYKHIGEIFGTAKEDMDIGITQLEGHFESFNDVLEKNKLGEFVENYKQKIGDFNTATPKAIENLVMLKQGYSKLDDFIADSKAKENGLSDLFTIGKTEGVDTSKLTEVAHALELIPEDKMIRLSVEGDGYEVVDNIEAAISKFTDGKHEAKIHISTEGDLGETERKLSQMQGEVCTVTLDADNQPASVKIGDVKMKVTSFNQETGMCTLLANDGATFTFDLVTGELNTLNGQEAEVTISANADGVSGIDEAKEKIEQLKGNGDVRFSINAQDNTAEVFDSANNKLMKLKGNENIQFQFSASGDLQVIDNISNEITTFFRDGKVETQEITVPVNAKAEVKQEKNGSLLADIKDTLFPTAHAAESTDVPVNVTATAGNVNTTELASGIQAAAQGVTFDGDVPVTTNVSMQIGSINTEALTGAISLAGQIISSFQSSTVTVTSNVTLIAGSIDTSSLMASINGAVSGITTSASAAVNVGTIDGTINYAMGDTPTSAPEIPGIVNYTGNFPTSAPTIYGTVVYKAKIEGAPRAKGDKDFKGGLAVVNDQKGISDPTELIEHDGQYMMFEGRDVVVPLSPHDKIYTAKQTQDILSGAILPHFAEGKENSDGFKTASENWTHYTNTHAVTVTEELAKWVEFSGQFKDNTKDVEDIEEKIYSLTVKINKENQTASTKWIQKRTFNNDWEDINDDPIAAFERVKQRNLEQLANSQQTWEEYYDNMSDFGKELYEGRLDQSYDWLEHEKEYNDMSTEDYIKGLRRMADYTLEYYQKGIIDHEEYRKKAVEIEEKYTDKVRELENARYERWKKDADNWKDIRDTFDDWSDYNDSPTQFYERSIQSIYEWYLGVEKTAENYQIMSDAILEAQLNWRKSFEEKVQGQKDGLSDILDMTKELIRKEKRDEIDALNDKIDAYTKIVNLKKEELSLSEDEYDYEKDLEKSRKELSKYKSELSDLNRDNSGDMSIEAQKKQLAEKIAEIQNDIQEKQHDRYVDIMKDGYDKDLEAYTNKQNEKIDALNDYLDKEGIIARDARKRLETEGDILYRALIEYNNIYGSGIEKDVVSNWEKAIEMIKEYGSVAKAAMAVESDDKSKYPSWSDAENMKNSQQSKAEKQFAANRANSIISEMKSNSAKWYSGMPQSEADDLHNKNAELAKQLAQIYRDQTGKWVDVKYDSDAGQWYRTDRRSNVYIYHDGLDKGFVGGTGFNSTQEQYAKLLKGELVVNPKQQMDFMQRILPNYTHAAVSAAGTQSITLDMSNMNLLTVQGNVTEGSMSELNTALRNAKNEIAQTVLDTMNIGLNKRGHKTAVTSVARKIL